MEKILINGNFLNRNLTGIERFACETCKRLDSLLTSSDDFSILISANPRFIPDFKNIKLIRTTETIKSFPKWDLLVFKKYCKKTNSIGLNFSNTAPLGKYCGYAFLHDIYAKIFPKDFTSFKDRIIKTYCRLNYKNISKNAKHIFTVSEFSSFQLQTEYKVPKEKITVIPNGWEHFKDIQPDENIFNKFPTLQKEKYFFTLGSLSKRKNLLWICHYAKNHPKETFAVSGKAISGLVPKELNDLKTLKNVVLLGYVTDEEVKALMKNCTAFIFPSYYEGFGIPPLEALSVGAKIIVSQAASLPEIYQNTAHYISPDDANVDLKTIMNEDVESPKEILLKYTYENAAEKLYSTLKNL